MRTAEISPKKQLISTLNEFLKEGSFPKNFRWWKTEISTLKKMEKSRNNNEKNIAANTIDYLCSYCYETGKEYLFKGKVDLAINIYRLGTIILPDSKYFYQQLSMLRSLGNKYELYHTIQNKPPKVA